MKNFNLKEYPDKDNKRSYSKIYALDFNIFDYLFWKDY
jgi:hypothetical protein